MGKLKDKVAVVTGASKGIGASIAKHLAAEGAAVVVNYASSRAGADRVVTEITRDGGRAIAVQADLARRPTLPGSFRTRSRPSGASTFSSTTRVFTSSGRSRTSPRSTFIGSST